MLIFHQGMLALLNATGLIDRPAFSMQPTEPWGVPQVISLAFWGGVWGVILLLVLRRISKPGTWWLVAIVFGMLATTLVALFVVAPIKGLPMAGGGKPATMMAALLVNGAWAFGTAIFLRLLRATPRIP